MEIQINNVVDGKIFDVHIAPESRAGTTNLIYEGRLIGDPNHLQTFVGAPPFELIFNGWQYLICRVSSSRGDFSYMRKNKLN